MTISHRIQQQLWASLIALLLLAVPAGAGATMENADEPTEPEATFTVPSSSYVKRALRFPLELPGLAIKVATSPLGGIFQAMEEKHAIERMADAMSNHDRTLWIYPIIGGGAGSGFGGGVGLRDTNLFYKGFDFNTFYAITTQLNQRLNATLEKKHAFSISGNPVAYTVEADWKRQLDQDYYGLGNNSVRSNQSKFQYANVEAGTRFDFTIIKNLDMLAHLGIIHADTGASTKGGKPSVNTTFPAAQIPGFDQRMTYVKFGFGIRHDTRDDDIFPEHGGTRSFNFYRYQTVQGGKFSYNEYTFDFHQYIQLWRPGIVLALHNGWRFEQKLGSNQVPFFRLSTLDASSPLRGFKRGRFRDRASVLVNIEYWYPIWTMMRGIVFFDGGRVFPDIQHFSFNRLKYSAGGGFDIDLKKVILFRFRAAYGGEGVNILFGITKQG